jgi:ankyrin repeat protein
VKKDKIGPRFRLMIKSCLIILISFSFISAQESPTAGQRPTKRATRNYAATYLGGNGRDSGNAMTLDSSGHVYVTGNTRSANFPTTANAYSATLKGQADVFVMKLDKDLKTIIASTLIGGDDIDVGTSIVCDKRGCVYVSGYTSSKNFPTTPAAFGPKFRGGDRDAFIIEMDADLTTLIASTYVGGSGTDDGGIALDPAGLVVLVGNTTSPDWPTTPGVRGQKPYGGSGDIFVVRFDADLKEQLTSTYIGGSGRDQVNAFAVDRKSGEIGLAGITSSPDYPTTQGAYAEAKDGWYITKISSDLAKITASTFFSGWIYNLLMHENGDIYVGGHARDELPTTSRARYRAFDNADDQGFISRFSGDLRELKASTVLPGSAMGGGGLVMSRDLAQSPDGSIISIGTVLPKDFRTTPGAFDETHNGGDEVPWGGNDIYVLKMTPELSEMRAATFVGGRKNDMGNQAVLDREGNIYVVGHTPSEDFPVTQGAAAEIFNGGDGDGILFRLGPDLRSDEFDRFHDAAKRNFLVTVQKISSADKARLETLDQYKRTALHWAAAYGSLDVFNYLLDNGASVTVKDESNNTPLHLAAMNKREGMVRRLLEKGADANAINSEGQTPLFLAAYYGTSGIIETLLSKNADPSIKDLNGLLPLHIAALSGNLEKLTTLLTPQADINARDVSGNTPLYLALDYTPREKIIAVLLQHGADVSLTASGGKSALHMALFARKEILDQLLKAGADVNAPDSDGNTALHGVLQLMARMLGNSGRSLSGDSAEFLASQSERLKMLLAHGADPRIKNKAGQSPQDLAAEIGDKELIDLLKGRR